MFDRYLGETSVAGNRGFSVRHYVDYVDPQVRDPSVPAARTRIIYVFFSFSAYYSFAVHILSEVIGYSSENKILHEERFSVVIIMLLLLPIRLYQKHGKKY